MIQYQFIEIPSGNNENLTDALAGLGERKRRIRAIIVNNKSTGVITAVTHRLRLYREQTRVVDYHLAAWYFSTASSDFEAVSLPIRIPVDLTLEVGEGLQVGLYSASTTTSSFNITMEYEDL